MQKTITYTVDGETHVWGHIRKTDSETDKLMRARDWVRRYYGQQSPIVETVKVAEAKP